MYAHRFWCRCDVMLSEHICARFGSVYSFCSVACYHYVIQENDSKRKREKKTLKKLTTNQIFKWVFFYSHELLLPFFCHFGLAWLSFWPERLTYTHSLRERNKYMSVCVCLVSRLFMNAEYIFDLVASFPNDRSMAMVFVFAFASLCVMRVNCVDIWWFWMAQTSGLKCANAWNEFRYIFQIERVPILIC